MKVKIKQILKQCSVLLVEDNSRVQAQIKEALLIYVNKVYLASNGEIALNIFDKERINIIFTDVKMPIMDGLSLTKSIRNKNMYIPIVVVSAYSEKSLLLDFMSQNLISYIVKPINFQDFSKVLKECALALEKHGVIELYLGNNFIYSYSKKMILKENLFISLSPKEILFLELLFQNNNKLVTKEKIAYEVWVNDTMSPAALNNLIAKIRKKTFSSLIINISTLGFMFVKP